jgi:hypothetical protein
MSSSTSLEMTTPTDDVPLKTVDSELVNYDDYDDDDYEMERDVVVYTAGDIGADNGDDEIEFESEPRMPPSRGSKRVRIRGKDIIRKLRSHFGMKQKLEPVSTAGRHEQERDRFCGLETFFAVIGITVFFLAFLGFLSLFIISLGTPDSSKQLWVEDVNTNSSSTGMMEDMVEFPCC